MGGKVDTFHILWNIHLQKTIVSSKNIVEVKFVLEQKWLYTELSDITIYFLQY